MESPPSPKIETQGDARLVTLALPEGLAELMILHGSLTVDGVSLTVNELPAPDLVQISLIEYTLSHTTLGALERATRADRGRRDRQVCETDVGAIQGGFHAPSSLHGQD